MKTNSAVFSHSNINSIVLYIKTRKQSSGTSRAAYYFPKGVADMAKNKKTLPSLWERSEYDVISETETETEIVAVLRTRYSGATITCRIPKHTKEEEEKLASDVTYALMQIAYTGQDISRLKNMEILME